MTDTTSPNAPHDFADPGARYRAELKEIQEDREMAGRFQPATTISWLAELDQEASEVRAALAELKQVA